ncbi:MAG: sulfotransferase [Salinisphaera sp.]|nr:sulfotransferase [Salinisphaera sp.]
MARPNFFIVGAPKSGTTALHHFLRQHPEIYMPAAKEPHFFGCADDPELPGRGRTLDQYLALFRGGEGKHSVGEASVYYLYSRQAARNIRAFNPDARVIIMLRNPITMIPSLHQQRVYSDNERLHDLDAALDAEVPRRRGEVRIPRKTLNPHALFYSEMGRYTVQVQRYLEIFDPKQIRIILFDDFVADLAKEYRATLAFLGVDPNFQPGFERVNDSKSIRRLWVRRWLERPLDKGRLRGLLPSRRRIYERLRRWNTLPGKATTVTEAQEQRLRQEFGDDIQALSKLLGRNLDHWVRCDSG